MLYTESDLEAAMDKIQTINFHEEKEVLDDIEDSYVATSSQINLSVRPSIAHWSTF